jgi:DNA-binding NarL/FixJ family response regulator
MVATDAGAGGAVIRVLVVSPRSGARRELQHVVARDTGLVLVDDESRPDVILLGPGTEAQQPLPLRLGLRAEHAATPLVVLLDDLDRTSAAQAVRAGARAVLPPHASPAEIGAAIRAAAAGLTSVPAVLARAVLEGESPDGRVLTPREREILTLLGEGLVNKEIAARLGVSEHTVKTHLAAIYDKLDAANRAEAVATGLRRGLIML